MGFVLQLSEDFEESSSTFESQYAFVCEPFAAVEEVLRDVELDVAASALERAPAGADLGLNSDFDFALMRRGESAAKIVDSADFVVEVVECPGFSGHYSGQNQSVE